MDIVRISADHRVRLRVYLNDHLAGAVGGMRLTIRCRGNNVGTPLAVFLDELLTELQDDYATLRRLLADLGLPVARAKQLGAMAAERVGRLKPNGRLAGYSPLSRLMELEALCAGVGAKRSLWLSLLEVQDGEPAVGRLDLDELLARAERQHQALEVHRRAAAAEALAASG